MKKTLFMLMTVMMFTACGADKKLENQTPNVSEVSSSQEKTAENQPTDTEIKAQWKNDQNEINEELRSLTEDYVKAVFEEAYGGKNKITDFQFSNAQQKMYDDDLELGFDLVFGYIHENGSEEKMNLSLKAVVEKEHGYIEPDEFKLYTVKTDSGNSAVSTIYKVIDNPETYFGEIDFENGKLELERKLWVNETGGYTPNGYFIVDADMEYRFDVAENCSVRCLENGSTLNKMDLKEFITKYNTDNRLFQVKMENNIVVEISECYRP